MATLGVFNEQPNLLFVDNTGKAVVDVGIDGATALPAGHAAGITIFDGNVDIPGGTGLARAIFGVTPSGTGVGEGIGTFDSSGTQRSFVSSAPGGSLAGAFFDDPSGALRTGIQYDPAGNFSGVFSQTASGHYLSALGSYIEDNAMARTQADQTFMYMGTAGILRVGEFQSSMNEGGLANDASDTLPGSWGNP